LQRENGTIVAGS